MFIENTSGVYSTSGVYPTGGAKLIIYGTYKRLGLLSLYPLQFQGNNSSRIEITNIFNFYAGMKT